MLIAGLLVKAGRDRGWDLPEAFEPRASLILVKARETKGAAALRCRWLDGRAAILMVVARPEDWTLAGIVRELSAPSCLVGVEQTPVPTSCRQAEIGTARVVSSASPRPSISSADLVRPPLRS